MESQVINWIRRVAKPIAQKQHYKHILKAVGDAQIVMIGEASHGTHEFYQQRAEITKLLIEEKGFAAVAVEADWPDAYRVNRYVQIGKHCRDKDEVESLGDFKRFPMWMWRNTVVADFVKWLRSHNEKISNIKERVAFYGMDLYSFYSSMEAVVEYLNKVSPEDAQKARESYSLFERFQGEPASYGFAAGVGFAPSLEKEVVQTLEDLREKSEEYLKGVGGLIDGDELFYAEQNAQLVKNAEEYYRKMYHADEKTWNIRDKHMVDCVSSLYEYHKKKYSNNKGTHKMVIWAHNSHLGDASATDSGKRRGEWNVGQLARERFGLEKTFNIGFSTYQGSVTAANEWDDPAALYSLRPGIPDSYELLFHRVLESSPEFQKQSSSSSSNMKQEEEEEEKEKEGFMLLFRSNNNNDDGSDTVIGSADHKRMMASLKGPFLERYVGVIYRPKSERASHYSRSNITEEYDALIYIDKTSALEPLDHTSLWKTGANVDRKRPVTN